LGVTGRAQADIEVGSDTAGVEAELCGTRAIDGGVKRRGINLLLQVGVDNPRDRRNTPLKLLCDTQVCGAVVADRSHVDLRREPEIENLRHHVGSLEIKHHLRKRRVERDAQLADVARGWRVPILQRNQDHAVIDPDGRAVGECQVVSPRRQPDVVDDSVPLAFGDDFSNLVLDRLKNLLGGLDPGSGRGADVQLNLPAVDRRKEIVTHQHQHRGPKAEHEDCDDRDDHASAEQRSEQIDISFAHSLEAVLEGVVDAAEPARWTAGVVAFTLEQQTDRYRRQGAREPVGRQHRKYHGKPERREHAGPSRKTTDVNTQLMASVETRVGTAMPAAPCRVAVGSGWPSSVSKRWVFSMVTVESSTRMPTASASPPRVIVLRVSPRKNRTVSEDKIARGIEIMTTTVDRHDPRNSRIIRAVKPAAIAPSRSTPSTDCLTNTD
jgi:hypothetical protein